MTKRRSQQTRKPRRFPGSPKRWAPGRGKKARGEALHWLKSHESVKQALSQRTTNGNRPVGFGANGEIVISLSSEYEITVYERGGVNRHPSIPLPLQMYTEQPVPTKCLPPSPADTIVVNGREVWWAMRGAAESYRFPSLLAAVVALKLMKEDTREPITKEVIEQARKHLESNMLDAAIYRSSSFFQSDEEKEDE